MKIVIDISEEDYLMMKALSENGMGSYAINVILNGIPEETAHWEMKEVRGDMMPCCSNCFADNYTEDKYCPHCGRRMENGLR